MSCSPEGVGSGFLRAKNAAQLMGPGVGLLCFPPSLHFMVLFVFLFPSLCVCIFVFICFFPPLVVQPPPKNSKSPPPLIEGVCLSFRVAPKPEVRADLQCWRARAWLAGRVSHWPGIAAPKKMVAVDLPAKS